MKVELTDEEKAAASILEWPDEKIGQYFRANVAQLSAQMITPKGSEIFFTVALALISMAREMNAGEFDLKLPDVTDKKRNCDDGSWRVTVKRTRQPRKKAGE
jgi:hypothetical protein